MGWQVMAMGVVRRRSWYRLRAGFWGRSIKGQLGGEWQHRYSELLALEDYDAGYRLVISP
jgi:hypothetical protein